MVRSRWLAAAAFAAAMTPAGAGAAAPLPLIDTLQVSPGHPYDQSKDSLVGGAHYELVVSGEVTDPTNASNPSYGTWIYDALYCHGAPNADHGCGTDASPARPSGSFGQLIFSDGVENDTSAAVPLDVFSGAAKGSIAYRSDHVYTAGFVAAAKGLLRVDMFDLRNCTSCSGQYDVELHGTAGLWMVPFRVHQRGLPFRNSPEAPQLAAVQTDMVGKVFFTAKPGHSANGSVAAAITHSDDYLTPGLQQYGQTAKIAPGAGEARFTQSTGRRVVSFTGSVTSVQSNGSGTIDQPLTVDQIAHIKITDDKRNVDGVAIAFARSASHGHLSHPYGKDRVRVTIGAPRRVGG